MPRADLYYDRVQIAPHLPRPGPECRDCDATSCRSFVERIENGSLRAEARRGPLRPEACPLLTTDRLHAFRIALAPEALIPDIEVSQLPRPVEPGLLATGAAASGTPVLVTAGHEGTVSFIAALLALTKTPLSLLIVETRGDSVDMSMILGSLDADRVVAALDAAIPSSGPRRPVVLPGFAAPLAAAVAARSGRRVIAGPVCGAELPLFLGDTWQAA